MRTCNILWALLLTLPGWGQFELPVKEQYDHIAHKQAFGIHAGVVEYAASTNPWSGYQFGEQVGYLLEGYLRMYEATRDKAYLIHFVNLSLNAMAWRNSDFLFTSGSVPYMNGVLLWPMAHFVHLVLAESNDLAGVVIPDGLIAYQSSNEAVNELPYSSAHTYASIATWFMYRCVESLDAILAEHWNTESMFCHGDEICAVNMQSGFAGALLYLGHLGNVNSTYSGLLSYLDKGAVLASMFSGDEPDDRCNCINGEPVLIPFANNSYWWHHNALGYKRRPCPYLFCGGESGWSDQEVDLSDHHQFVEDISHGVIDLLIPTLSNRFGLYTNGEYPFTEADLVRFRNAFTKHIAQWNGSGWQFKNAVDGSDGPVCLWDSDNEECIDYPPTNTFRYAALAWMPLQAYDGATGAAAGDNVYDVIMDFYADEVFGSPGVITGGLYHMGVADVVAAQWENECYSLTLFNRDLVYDQDFTARAVLTVDAFGEGGASFADPVITDPRFTVNDGITSSFRAGAAVVWEPGFEAAYGSTVVSEIDPLGCGMEYRVLAAGGMVQGEQAVAQRGDELPGPTTDSYVEEKARAKSHRVSLAPNPTSGSVRVQLELEAPCSLRVELRDGMGRSMLVADLGVRDTGWQEHLLQLGPVPPGVYWCRLFLGEETQVLKLVVE